MDVTTPTPAAEGAFVVELDRFQGPLDLLLHLIRQQDIDIFDIPISQITHQFLAAIEAVYTHGLDRAGEFLEMAATLIRIKAQMLLPRRVDESGVMEDPRAELVRRLLEYEHFREAAERLSAAESERGRHYSRGFVPPKEPKPEPVTVIELQCTWDEVFAAALGLTDRVKPPVEHRVVQRAVPLEEKVGLILHTLARVERIEFSRLVEPYHDRLHTVITFMAGLELAKQRQVAVRQREPFSALWLYRRKEEEEHTATVGEEFSEELPADEPLDADDAFGVDDQTSDIELFSDLAIFTEGEHASLAPQEDVSATHQDDVSVSPQEDVSVAPQQDDAAGPREEELAEPDKGPDDDMEQEGSSVA